MVTTLVTEKKKLLQINLKIHIQDTFLSSIVRLFWELVPKQCIDIFLVKPEEKSHKVASNHR